MGGVAVGTAAGLLVGPDVGGVVLGALVGPTVGADVEEVVVGILGELVGVALVVVGPVVGLSVGPAEGDSVELVGRLAVSDTRLTPPTTRTV